MHANKHLVNREWVPHYKLYKIMQQIASTSIPYLGAHNRSVFKGS